jgi:ribosomal protein L17
MTIKWTDVKTTKEKAKEAKAHVELMLMMIAVGRTEEAERHLGKTLAYLNLLMEDE